MRAVTATTVAFCFRQLSGMRYARSVSRKDKRKIIGRQLVSASSRRLLNINKDPFSQIDTSKFTAIKMVQKLYPQVQTCGAALASAASSVYRPVQSRTLCKC